MSSYRATGTALVHALTVRYLRGIYAQELRRLAKLADERAWAKG